MTQPNPKREALADYTEQAREMIQRHLLASIDPSVRAVAMLCDPPQESVQRVAAALRARANEGDVG